MATVDKPQVRATDSSGEIPLETWAAVASRDLLNRLTLVSMLAGVSTRAYHTVLEPAGPEIDQLSSLERLADQVAASTTTSPSPRCLCAAATPSCPGPRSRA